MTRESVLTTPFSIAIPTRCVDTRVEVGIGVGFVGDADTESKTVLVGFRTFAAAVSVEVRGESGGVNEAAGNGVRLTWATAVDDCPETEALGLEPSDWQLARLASTSISPNIVRLTPKSLLDNS